MKKLERRGTLRERKLSDGTLQRGYSITHSVTTSFTNYIGEAGINLWTKRTRGRARRSDRAVRIVQERRGQNLTITFAVNVMNGLVHHELHLGGMTAERFSQLLHDTSPQCNPRQEMTMLAHTVEVLKLICQLNLNYSTYHLLHLF
ncbi:transposase [Elysia marginata]|uniref:Transposase n=1 Tax=Elysia marginata TaxID=1093978 RepID=A0AAV4IE27_9GAST|nr:transposase [Elysia marginata]